MKHVFTDPRFPGYSIVTDGGPAYSIQRAGKVVHCFESVASRDSAFIARRAEGVFERWAALLEDGESGPVPPEDLEAVDHSDIFNAPAPSPSAQIDRLMPRLQHVTDPGQRQRLQQHIMHLMKQEGSLAAAVVNRLLYS